MTKYRKNFKKIVHGYIEVEADSPEEAEEWRLEGGGVEFDNKSGYEFEDWKEA